MTVSMEGVTGATYQLSTDDIADTIGDRQARPMSATFLISTGTCGSVIFGFEQELSLTESVD